MYCELHASRVEGDKKNYIANTIVFIWIKYVYLVIYFKYMVVQI